MLITISNEKAIEISSPDDVTKDNQGIYANGYKVLIKSYVIYAIMYKLNIDDKEKAQKVYDELHPLALLALCANDK